MRTFKVFVSGIVIGILFAPDRGAKTRQKLLQIFLDYKEDAKDYVSEVADKVESGVKSAKKAVKKL